MAAETATASDFERGLAALQAGKNADAITAFEAAYHADGNPSALMNLGIAYTNEGMLNQAVEALTRYTQRADVTRDAQTIAQVQAEIERIRTSNGVVVVHVAPENASIQVDGQMLSPLNGELVLAPGQRRFLVFAEGFVSYDQVMAVAAGRFSLDVTLTPVSAAPVQLPEPAVAAPAAPATPAAADAEQVDEPQPAAKPSNCVLSSVCFGPVLSLIGPPNLIGGGLHFRFGENFGAGVEYQATPRIALDPVAVSVSLFSVNARAYPFGGAFFLGGGFGYQSLSGQVETANVKVSANAGFPALMAGVGFMGHSGFVMGMDAAVLVPIGSRRVAVDDMQVRGDVNGMPVPQQMIDDARGDVERGLRKIVNALPISAQVNLLRIGYLF